MRTALVRDGFGAAGIARRGRKVRTSDCRKCFLLQSFRNAGLPATTIDALCEQMWLNRVHRRQILYVDGNRATHLYAIRSGKVKLVRPVASGVWLREPSWQSPTGANHQTTAQEECT